MTLNVTGANICLNSTVAFTCGAQANPEVDSYQLKKNNINILSTRKSGVWTNTISEEGEFSYSCVANNSVGTRKSNIVNVTIFGKGVVVLRYTYWPEFSLFLGCNMNSLSDLFSLHARGYIEFYLHLRLCCFFGSSTIHSRHE